MQKWKGRKPWAILRSIQFSLAIGDKEEYYEEEYYGIQLYAKKQDNLNEMNKFLGKHRLPQPTQEETDNLNRSTTSQ